MSVENTDYDVSTSKSSSQPGSGATDGPGGSTMDIWTADRVTKLNQLAGGTFTNESSFSVPAGVVNSSTNGYTTAWENQEKYNGVHAKGQSLSAEGKPLSGTLSIEAGGQVFKEKTVSGGSFAISIHPPFGAFVGQSLGLDEYGFRFAPSQPGVDYFAQNIGTKHDAGEIQYGQVQGTIQDFNGEPMPNVSVGGRGSADITDDAGKWVLIAPGGSTVTLTTLNGSYDFDVTLDPGATKTVNVTFPQLAIKVIDADLEPVEGAPVDIDGTTYHTGPGGKVEISDAEVKNYNVAVMDTFEAKGLSVSQAGQEYVYTVGPGASFGENTNLQIGGVKISAIDSESGQGISELVAMEKTSGTRSLSNNEGVCKLLTEETGQEVDVLVGTGDKRYLPARIAGTISQDEMLDVTVELEPRTQVTNS